MLLRRRISLAGLVAFALLAFGAVDDASGRSTATLTVCQNGASYSTIQDAVTAAANGDTIQVCAGIFTEQVVIPSTLSNVTLQGAAKQSVISAPASMTGEKAIVEVAGAHGVTVTGFTISGPGSTNCNSLRYGVEVDSGGSATVTANDITDIRDSEIPGGCPNGWGIGAGVLSTVASGTDSGNVIATNNRITNFQKSAILLKGAGSVDVVTGNTVVGFGPTSQATQNGIQVSAGASATISGNDISADHFTGPDDQATGILLYSTLQNVVVSNNVVHDNDVGIDAFAVTPAGTVVVSGNTIAGSHTGIVVNGATGVTFRNNTVTGSSANGIVGDGSSHENVFDSNNVSGAPPGQFDCLDNSSGSGTDGTDNTWTANTCGSSSPEGIGSPPITPPVVIDTPTVIVLPVSPTGEQQPAQPAGPIAEASADEIVTKMKDNNVESCAVKATAKGPNHLVVSTGVTHVPAGKARPLMVVRLQATPTAKKVADKPFGGVTAFVKAKCRTTSGKTSSGTKSVRVVLSVEHVVTPPGSWLPDQAVLTPAGERFIQHLKQRMIAIVRIRCDGYTAMYPPSPVDAQTLSLDRAKVVCSALKRTGVAVEPRLVPHGTANPIAANDTETGRAENRRVAITFLHKLTERRVRSE